MFNLICTTTGSWSLIPFSWIICYTRWEAVAQRRSVKKVFLEMSQNSQENTCVTVSFLIKLQAESATLLKKRLWYRCFPVDLAKFLGTLFLTEHLRQLLLLGAASWMSSVLISILASLDICWYIWHDRHLKEKFFTSIIKLEKKKC